MMGRQEMVRFVCAPADIERGDPLRSAIAIAVLFVIGCGAPATTASPPPPDVTGDVTFTDRVHIMPLQGTRGALDAAPIAPAAPVGARLSYGGGKLIQNAHVTQVLYGPGSYIPQLTATSGATMATAYHQMVSSGVYDWLDEYDTISPAQTIGRGSFAGSVLITPSSSHDGATISDASVQSEIVAQILAGKLPAPDDNQIYMVSFPAGTSIVAPDGSQSCVQFCAYHGTFKIRAQNVYYAVLPALNGGCASGCGSGTAFEKQQVVASRELVEVLTDPEVGLATTIGPPLAWYHGGHDEIGDICDGQQSAYFANDGIMYTIHDEFSNRQGDCVATRTQPVATAFEQFAQNYDGLDFGLPSSWQPISGDFNGDGLTDYARLGSTGAWIFVANGDGTFGTGFQSYVDTVPPLNFSSPSSWQTITGDFNGDGKIDYARLGDTLAWIFLATGDGGFRKVLQDYADTAPQLSFGMPSPWQVVTGDFNGDGKTDYARLGDTDAWIFLASGDGTFGKTVQHYADLAPPARFGLPSVWQAIAGDFNGDGKTDYARLGDTGAWIFLASGDGSFNGVSQRYVDLTPPVNFGLPSAWQAITGDFNGDGKADYARLGDTGAWLFLALQDGTFTPRFQSYVDTTPQLFFGLPSTWQPISGDFDGDGRTDYARLGDTGAWLFLVLPDGTFLKEFQSYVAQTPPLHFGAPSAWQIVTGKFTRSGNAGYIRLGGPNAFVFVRR